MRRNTLTLGLLVVAALTVFSSCGPLRAAGPEKDLAPVLQAYQILQEHYVDKSAVDPKKLSPAAIQAMVASLGDKFTVYYDAEHFKAAQNFVTNGDGAFEGIGATMDIVNGRPVIRSPLPNTPAQKAGLRSGDVVMSIEGKSTEGIPLDQIVSMVRGPKESVVHLQVLRPKTNQTLEFAITRTTIQTVSVSYALLADDIAQVNIYQFIEKTNDDLASTLTSLKEAGVKGIVLDLRDNPGGLVDQVIKIASQFLNDGLVGYEIDNTGKRTDWKVSGSGTAKELPLVVLVNGGSASGSEVLTGALQDQKRGTIIGTQTYGKGSVGQQYSLSDGSGINVIFAKWYTPNGRQINHVGIMPDVVVAGDQGSVEDPQLQKGIELLKAKLPAKSAAQPREVLHAG